MTPTGVVGAWGVLVQHGIDPEADVDERTTLIEARGWHVSLEPVRGFGGGRPPRWSGRVTSPVSPGSPVSSRPNHIAISGPDGRGVLARMLARVLDKEGEA